MARFLVGTIPVIGYVTPMLPLVTKLVKRGHDVWWYTGKLFQTEVQASGATFVAMTAGLDFSVIENIPPEWEQERQSLNGLAQLRFDLNHFFIDHAIGQVQDYQVILKNFPADMLLSDSYFLGSAWIHELGGPPWAQLGTSVLTFPSQDIPPFGLGLQPAESTSGRLRDRALKTVTDLVLRGIRKDVRTARQQVGLADNKQFLFDTLSPFLYLATTVPGFEYPRSDLPPQVHFIGPPKLDLAEDFELPAWWSDLQGDQPVVCVTQDAIANNISELILPTLEALRDQNVLVVAITSAQFPPDFKQPLNARVAPSISMHHLLPHVDMMVTNGEYRTVQIALSYGIPLIAAGQSEDKPEVCARIAWSGIGLNLNTKRPKPQQISQAVEKILADKQYQQKAQQLQIEIAQYNSAELAVEYLETLLKNLTNQ